MEISVWDTYVKREDQKMMHFDILVPSDITNEQIIFDYGRAYLASKNFSTGTLSSRECRFCHVEQASEAVIECIRENGYYIIEMENCH